MNYIKIIGLEGQAEGVVVQAQFNPSEIVVSHSVEWQQQPKKGPADLEYTGSAPKTMAFELLFDGFESATSVQPHIAKLHQLSGVDPVLKRPPKVKINYGPDRATGVVPKFEAVIESISVRYLMFSPNGVVLRATASLKFREARNVKAGKP